MLHRLKEGLRRTRESLSRGLGLERREGPPDWERIEEALLGADLGIAATRDLVEGLRASGDHDPQDALRERLLAILSEPARDTGRPGPSPSLEVVLVVGVNGVGKTTTVAKLAHRNVQEGKATLVVAADTFRAAALEQLETWSKRAGAELVRGRPGADSASVVHEGIQGALARRFDTVIVDTAGRLHTKRPLMDELAKVKRIASRLVDGAPHQTLLVMDATVGTNGLIQARQFHEAVGLTGIVLAKLDGTARGGIVVAIARELGLPVVAVGVGEGLSDLLPFSAEQFVEALLGADQ